MRICAADHQAAFPHMHKPRASTATGHKLLWYQCLYLALPGRMFTQLAQCLCICIGSHAEACAPCKTPLGTHAIHQHHPHALRTVAQRRRMTDVTLHVTGQMTQRALYVHCTNEILTPLCLVCRFGASRWSHARVHLRAGIRLLLNEGCPAHTTPKA